MKQAELMDMAELPLFPSLLLSAKAHAATTPAPGATCVAQDPPRHLPLIPTQSDVVLASGNLVPPSSGEKRTEIQE